MSTFYKGDKRCLVCVEQLIVQAAEERKVMKLSLLMAVGLIPSTVFVVAMLMLPKKVTCATIAETMFAPSVTR